MRPPPPATPRPGGPFLPLSLPLTVHLTMSSPGAPPPPLSPEGATEGAVRTKEHRRGSWAGSKAREATSLCLRRGLGLRALESGRTYHQILPLPLPSCVSLSKFLNLSEPEPPSVR